VLLGVFIIFLIGILILYRQSRLRKKANRSTTLSPYGSTTHLNRLKSQPSTRQKKGEDAKRVQNLAWGVVDDDEEGENGRDVEKGAYHEKQPSFPEMGTGIGGLSSDALKRMGMARSDSGLIGTAIMHERKQSFHNASPGPQAPARTLDKPDSHQKMISKSSPVRTQAPTRPSSSSRSPQRHDAQPPIYQQRTSPVKNHSPSKSSPLNGATSPATWPAPSATAPPQRPERTGVTKAKSTESVFIESYYK
jgi:hypothetical protein